MKRTDKTIPKPSKEQVLKAANLADAEARFLVSNYYEAQEGRKRSDMQLRHVGEKALEDNMEILQWSGQVFSIVEQRVVKFLESYAEGKAPGRWMLAQYGIGPIIAAGILAHVDIEKAPTVGHIWRFAGLDPTCEWKKGEKRPYNAHLKQICWHAGECFKRTSNRSECYYGHLYREKKVQLVAKNEAGGFAERAKIFYTKSAEVRKTLAEGKLPAGNLDSQATRFAVKIFLSHLHALWFWDHYKKPPPKPFAIAILGHGHEIRVNDSHMFPGFDLAYYGREMSEAAE